MEQAFILPLPRYSGLELTELARQDDITRRGEILVWHSVLDKLSERKISWDQLGAYFSCSREEFLSHPLVRMACDRNGQTLLHLAVIHEQTWWVELLASDEQLKQRRSHFGLTPFELARFLYRNIYLPLLASPPLELPNLESNLIMEEKEKSFIPISCPIFENEKILHDVLEQTRKAKDQDLILPEKIWMGIYFDKEIQTGLNPRLSVRYVDEEIGYGVFAEQKIPACSFVGEYMGIIRERSAQFIKDKIYCMRYNCWQTGRRQFVVDAETHGNYTRFINHSAHPNLALKSVYWRGLPRMIFISLKEIAKGAQLTFDYGRSFWKEVAREPRCLA